MRIRPFYAIVAAAILALTIYATISLWPSGSPADLRAVAVSLIAIGAFVFGASLAAQLQGGRASTILRLIAFLFFLASTTSVVLCCLLSRSIPLTITIWGVEGILFLLAAKPASKLR